MGKRLEAEFQNIVHKYSEHEENLEPASKKKRDENI